MRKTKQKEPKNTCIVIGKKKPHIKKANCFLGFSHVCEDLWMKSISFPPFMYVYENRRP